MEEGLNILYREVIMDHYKNPRNRGLKKGLEVYQINNPTCGDKVKIQLELKDCVIQNIYHEGIGCSISMSSCSIMSESLKDKTIDEAIVFIENFIKRLNGEAYDESLDMGDALVYDGIKNFPARFKCATISWELLLNALKLLKKKKEGV